MIKVRFAPSPTGYLHIGGARTALFNWLYAKSQKGQFVLRIEDTDQVRSKKEFENEILDSMKWLGMDWDELHYQSDRFDLYREYANKLVEEGKAYKDGDAILLKMPKQEIKLYDVIRGEITFDTSNFVKRDVEGENVVDEDGEAVLKDEVLMKADGSPAYSFCCVVDDALMGITTVIRGEDHISNTPKQLVMYQALGFKSPKFAHLPLIMGEDGGRLSKRTGAVAVSDYKQGGFLPEAIVNYLMLLGWSPGNDQEKIDTTSAIKKFSLKKVNKAAAVFSLDKLKWLNAQYIKEMSTTQLTDLLIPFLKDKKYILDDFDRHILENIVHLYKGRIPTLRDFIERAGFIFSDEYSLDKEAEEEHLSQDRNKEFSLLVEKYSGIEDFTAENAEKYFKEVVSELNLKMSDLVHPVRVAISGSAIGPSLFEIMGVLGKEKSIKGYLRIFNDLRRFLMFARLNFVIIFLSIILMGCNTIKETSVGAVKGASSGLKKDVVVVKESFPEIRKADAWLEENLW